MKKKLIWSSTIEFDKEQVKRKINQLENKWKVKFPKSYIDNIINYDGARFYILDENEEKQFTAVKIWDNRLHGVYILSLKEKEFHGEMTTSLEITYNVTKGYLPERVYPFAVNGGDDVYLFDYRKNTKEPEICFLYDHDGIDRDDYDEDELDGKTLEEAQNDTIHKIFNSFDELLDNIVIDDED